MPQLLLLVAVGAVAWLGYKRFLAEAERVSAKVRDAEKESRTGAQGTRLRDLQPYDMEVGAGTFHPATTLRSLGSGPGPRPTCSPRAGRPTGATAKTPTGCSTITSTRCSSNPRRRTCRTSISARSRPSASTWLHDIRFVEDDWESPTLGAWGLGWEVWCDGMEVSPVHLFPAGRRHDCHPVSGELTYGLERLAMYVQGVDHVYGHAFNDPDGADPRSELRRCLPPDGGGIFAPQLRDRRDRDAAAPFRGCRGRVPAPAGRAAPTTPSTGKRIVLAHPAYDQCIKASHLFNLLDARGVISVTERQAYIFAQGWTQTEPDSSIVRNRSQALEPIFSPAGLRLARLSRDEWPE
jgi:glycyl-tRNA synthetase alpha chain